MWSLSKLILNFKDAQAIAQAFMAPIWSFLQGCRPIEDHGRRGGSRFADQRSDHEPLAVGRNVEFAKDGAL